MSDAAEQIGAVIAGVVGLAVVAVVVSSNAQTPNVLSAFFGGLANLVGVAVSPVTGQSVSGLTTGMAGGSWLGSGYTSGYAVNQTGGSLGISTPNFGLNLSGLTSMFGSGSGSSGGFGGLGSGGIGSLFGSGSSGIDTGSFASMDALPAGF